MENGLNKKIALFVTTLGAFITPLGTTSVNVALPSIGKEFGMGAISLSWVLTAFLLASAVALVPLGKLGDIYGRKRVFTFSVLIFTIASIALSVSTSALMLICFRILQGIGGGAIYGTGVAILTSVFPAWERGKVLGVNVAAVYLGASLGPFLGGMLTQHLGWRSIFLLNIFLGLIILFLTIWKLKGEWAEAKGEKFDVVGSVLYGITLLVVMYGFSLLPAVSGAGLMLSGALGIFVFIKWETKMESPVLDINLFRNNRAFAFSNLAALINYSATFAVAFLLSLYLQYIKRLSPQSAGFILVCQPFVQAIFSPFTGRFSDRIEPRIVASIGMTFTTLGLFLLAFLNEKTTVGFVLGCLVLLGFGLALFSSPNTNSVMSSVEKRFYGMAAGIVSTMRVTGQMFSIGITTMIFAIYIGSVQITPEYYPFFLKGVTSSFSLFAVLCFGGIFASLARGKIR